MTAEHVRDLGRIKRRFLLYVGAMLGTATLINGLIYAQVQDQQRQLQQTVTSIQEGSDSQVRQTLLGCQRGNELRRAVLEVARARGTKIDPDAVRITSCRLTVIAVNGVDPGLVDDYVETNSGG